MDIFLIIVVFAEPTLVICYVLYLIIVPLPPDDLEFTEYELINDQKQIS